MRSGFIIRMGLLRMAFLAALTGASGALAAPMLGAAMHGAPELKEGFESLPYANPDAPKGGVLTLGERGGFDSLNPYILKGRAPWAMRTKVFESLMARSWDEPFTLYGLLAESIDIAEDYSAVTFQLRPEARFSDGEPVTPEDVIFSINTLIDKGKANYERYFGGVEKMEIVGERGVRFTLTGDDRELPMLIGLAPILAKHYWAERDFAQSTLEPPIASGPYLVGDVDPGASISFERDPDYWGADLPVNAGLHNFDRIDYLYFKDGDALWEAFRGGEIDQFREDDLARWAEGYDFPAALSGEVIKGEIKHKRASGMKGFVFNTRNPLFKDRRVREALTLAFDFEWANKAFYHGGQQRIRSYFSNSDLGFSGPAEGRERELLEPFANDLPKGTLEAGYTPPISDGSGRDRNNLRAAKALLEEAGWRVEDGALRNEAGEAFSFEILLRSSADEKLAAGFKNALEPLGINVSIRLADSAQYVERLKAYDFDMIINNWWLSLSPGNEQKLYWSIESAETPGARNYPGVKSAAVDAMIQALLEAESREDYAAAVRALDRALMAGRYVIPLGGISSDRFAWWDRIDKPKRDPLYGYRPEVWWSTETEATSE